MKSSTWAADSFVEIAISHYGLNCSVSGSTVTALRCRGYPDDDRGLRCQTESNTPPASRYIHVETSITDMLKTVVVYHYYDDEATPVEIGRAWLAADGSARLRGFRR